MEINNASHMQNMKDMLQVFVSKIRHLLLYGKPEDMSKWFEEDEAMIMSLPGSSAGVLSLAMQKNDVIIYGNLLTVVCDKCCADRNELMPKSY